VEGKAKARYKKTREGDRDCRLEKIKKIRFGGFFLQRDWDESKILVL